jgi:hypothetical protein
MYNGVPLAFGWCEYVTWKQEYAKLGIPEEAPSFLMTSPMYGFIIKGSKIRTLSIF